MKLKTTTIPEVKDTIVILRELSADEQLRRLAEIREKRLHDEASNLNGARREGIQIGIQQGEVKGRNDRDNELIEKWKKKGYSDEQIKEFLS